ncbi:MAG: hypothetical protein ACFFCZ_19790 [Promethearchaeota archaeon]
MELEKILAVILWILGIVAFGLAALNLPPFISSGMPEAQIQFFGLIGTAFLICGTLFYKDSQ